MKAEGTVRLRPYDLARDGLVSAAAQPVATLTASAVVAIVCMVVLLTTGKSAAAERDVIASIESVGTRMVTVTDATGRASIDRSAVAAISSLNGVTWAFGIGPARDAYNADLGPAAGSVAMRPLVGNLPEDVNVRQGRHAVAPGEAYVGVTAIEDLHLVDVVGAVSDGNTRAGTVAEIDAVGPLSFLDEVVVRVPGPDEQFPVRYIYVLIDDATFASEMAQAISAVLPAGDPSAVEVSTSEDVVVLRDVIAGKLGSSSRQLMVGVLALGLVLVCVTMLGAVSAKRRDFGRRRALGATRSAIVGLVLVQSVASGLVGAAAGTGLGIAALFAMEDAVPPPSFVCGVALLSILVALVGAAPPALTAASRDPVRILRVP